MQSLATVIVLFLMLVLSTSAQHVRYVKPNDSPPQDCPGQPCLTLDQYTWQTKTYFTSGATFLFLVGNHTLKNTINLTNISIITIKGYDKDSITVMCRNTIVLCENVKNLIIEGLIFKLHSSNILPNFSALRLYNSTGIQISNSTFQGNGKLNETETRAVYSINSIITIVRCLFRGNTGNNGGAVYANGSNITFNGNIFTRNIAKGSGGTIYAQSSSIILTNEFKYHSDGASIREYYSNIYYTSNSKGTISFKNHNTMPSTALFLSNEAYNNGGAIYLSDSNASLSGIVIAFINNSARNGGGMYIERHKKSTAHVATNTEHLYFIGNKAVSDSGAIYVIGVSLTLGETMNSKNNHYFLNNSMSAILCSSGSVNMTGNSVFMYNGHWPSYASGGAIHVGEGILTITGSVIFHSNKANLGGAITVSNSTAVLDGMIVKFEENSALEEGGGIYSTESNLTIKAQQLNFIGNVAQTGGAVSIDTFFVSQQAHISGNFINNTGGKCGGAVSVEGKHNITFTDITATGNSGCAFCFVTSKVTFNGYTRITSNIGKFGGGINSKNSILLFTDNIEIRYNKALLGGAIYSLYGEVTFQNTRTGNITDIALFTYNTADRDGGALYVTGTDITLKRQVHFVSNSAQNGGAIYFTTAATLTLETKGAVLSTSHNYASEFGGVLYSEDAATYTQCISEFINYNEARIEELPYCLLQLKDDDPQKFTLSTPITSYLNSAWQGEFMYGGLLDRCRMDINVGSIQIGAFTAYKYLTEYLPHNNITEEMTSLPYRLCFCKSNQMHNCSEEKSLSIQRGQLMRISLIAFDQTRTAVSTQITAITSPTARLELNQSPQVLPQKCSSLTYNLYSTENHEELILYCDSPCHDTGLARAVIILTIRPCPDGFTQSTSQCVCEERLQVYGAECIINDTIYITKKAGSNFWMSSLTKNETYQGLVLFKTCPLDYCTSKNVNLTLDNPDIQCDHNRSGVLCGKCSANYSLLLGSFKCQICSSTYLALLFPFAAAGIALVIALFLLRLTVATGMINSIILYANIVQVNRYMFLTNNKKNVLTVFIAWLNLDLGFETCFYHGMDAYAQTWLQFAFPLFVWTLIILIIIISRYSITVSKLIGHNPIAVLATLLLMSYTKILKIIIEVYSSVDLDYPDNNKVTVWLKDANVPYLQSKHLLLTVVTSLIFVFLFLPYTLLLLLGHKLYRFTSRKGLHWLNKIKPLLDSYYAPYKKHTRYWTGFLLLVRCALYIVFSFNSLGATTKSLLAINITFTAIVVLAWLSTLIYRNFYVNIIEASIYLNLIVLSAATLAGANTRALVYSLVCIVFATNVGVIVYHFHLLYTAKSSVWLKTRAKINSCINTFETLTANATAVPPPVSVPANTSSHDPHRIVSKTVIDLREPLLEN